MSQELERLAAQARLARCWGDEPAPELLERIEAEKRKDRPSQELERTLSYLRQTWRKTSASRKRNRHIFFLGSVYEQVCEWRRLKRQDELEASLKKYFDIDQDRDIFQSLLITVCGDQIDRKIRYRWAACLRTIERHKTPEDLGAAQIIRLGGINRCAAR